MLSKPIATNKFKLFKSNLLFFKKRAPSLFLVLALTAWLFYFLLLPPSIPEMKLQEMQSLRWIPLNNSEFSCPNPIQPEEFYEYAHEDMVIEFYFSRDRTIYLDERWANYIALHPRANTCEKIISPADIQEI